VLCLTFNIACTATLILVRLLETGRNVLSSAEVFVQKTATTNNPNHKPWKHDFIFSVFSMLCWAEEHPRHLQMQKYTSGTSPCGKPLLHRGMI